MIPIEGFLNIIFYTSVMLYFFLQSTPFFRLVDSTGGVCVPVS